MIIPTSMSQLFNQNLKKNHNKKNIGLIIFPRNIYQEYFLDKKGLRHLKKINVWIKVKKMRILRKKELIIKSLILHKYVHNWSRLLCLEELSKKLLFSLLLKIVVFFIEIGYGQKM